MLRIVLIVSFRREGIVLYLAISPISRIVFGIQQMSISIY